MKLYVLAYLYVLAALGALVGYGWLLSWLLDHHPDAWYTKAALLVVIAVAAVGYARSGGKGRRR